ncbi:MAG: DUF4101 domain-containing protein [Gloeomargaritaceae cyanobacterium C42_A2020_066]|nr:DUF4101 domain-containing protein [Gloeomargaritaceae cyanobacterium C42_A2020_066]
MTLRLPLDYYRILGVPAQAQDRALAEACRDRLEQQPRREFSPVATAGRRQLVEEAYRVLADPQARHAYDEQFLQAVGRGDQARLAPTLAVTPEQVPGALLLLLEWGEYELVLEWGRDALEAQPSPAARQDTILTLTLAHLALGRERWQQQRYPEAGRWLEEGLALCAPEPALANLHHELSLDLARLRPYRILEMVSQSPGEAGRIQGIQLLSEMLLARGGVEGQQDDQSGLNVEDGLGFIQQVRPALTTAEQIQVFDQPALATSAATTYLAAYAHLAAGFIHRQPSHLETALTRLATLAPRQDVALEQAMAHLLLGRPQSALDSLADLRDADLRTTLDTLTPPGEDAVLALYRYGEYWLRTDVLPYCREGLNQSAALETYFNDPHLQTQLEALEAVHSPPPPLRPADATPPKPPVPQQTWASRATPARRPTPRPHWSLWLGLGAALSLIGATAWSLSRRPAPPPERLEVNLTQPPVPLPTRAPRPTASPVGEAAATETARRVITTWQTIKAEAMGPNHATRRLTEVLTGTALTQWQARADQVATSGTPEVYSLEKLEILTVQAPTPDRLVADAALQDRVTVQGENLTSRYRARYEMVREAQGWRIARMTVLP